VKICCGFVNISWRLNFALISMISYYSLIDPLHPKHF
jgi:hypothetical protein